MKPYLVWVNEGWDGWVGLEFDTRQAAMNFMAKETEPCVLTVFVSKSEGKTR
jgi:hypothetical protein